MCEEGSREEILDAVYGVHWGILRSSSKEDGIQACGKGKEMPLGNQLNHDKERNKLRTKLSTQRRGRRGGANKYAFIYIYHFHTRNMRKLIEKCLDQYSVPILNASFP